MDVVTTFNQHYFDSGAWENTIYTHSSGQAAPIYKYPTDLWIYHEIIAEVRPDWIVELGTAKGGSAAWFDDQVAPYGGQVITIDVIDYREVHPPRVKFFKASSLEVPTFKKVKALISPDETCLVSLDSDHLMAHVAQELSLWPRLVTTGSYLVVEDTVIDAFDRPGHRFKDGGPAKALGPWLTTHPGFEVDSSRDKFMLSMNPGGWVRKL